MNWKHVIEQLRTKAKACRQLDIFPPGFPPVLADQLRAEVIRGEMYRDIAQALEAGLEEEDAQQR